MLQRYPGVMVVIVAGLLLISSFSGVTYCYFNDDRGSGTNVLTAWTSQIWTVNKTVNFTEGLAVNVNTSGNEVKLNRNVFNPYIYALQGNNTRNFSRYDVSTNIWTPMNTTPGTIFDGGALVYTGSNYLYALGGGGTQNFYRYNISGDIWSTMTTTPAAVGAGGALTFNGTDIHAIRGGNTKDFWSYNLTSGIWTTLPQVPRNVPNNGALVYGGNNITYAFAGNQNGIFFGYDRTTNTWNQYALSGLNPLAGAAMTWVGGDRLYAFEGGGTQKFNYYSKTANAWNPLTNTPAAVGAGGALTNDGSTSIYGLAGNALRNFSRYSIATNTWTVMNNTLFAVGWGGSLAYAQAPGSGCYFSEGSIASIVFDTTTPNSRWDLLVWNATIPLNTKLNMSVRASNTQFLMTDTSPAWIPVIGTMSGGNYMVAYPNLPSGQYLQWRANLSTSACANTSVLYEVNVYFSDWYTPLGVSAVSPASLLTASPPVSLAEAVKVPITTVITIPTVNLTANMTPVNTTAAPVPTTQKIYIVLR